MRLKLFVLLSLIVPVLSAQAQGSGMGSKLTILIPIVFVVGLLIMTAIFFVSRYKRCPSDKILVVYGKTGGETSSRCYAGGAAFIWPVIQDYGFMNLTPISIDVDLLGALSKQNIRVDVPSQFTVAISNKPQLMIKAAERLFGKDKGQISTLASDIILGQLRLVVAQMDIEEINSDRDKLLSNIMSNVSNEIEKIGLELINVNIKDIKDESGYLQALGQKAASEAINQAKIEVAMEDKKGAIGEAEQDNQKRVSVAAEKAAAMIGEAEATKNERTQVASANSAAEVGEANAEARKVEGVNTATIAKADSDSLRRKSVAEAEKAAKVTEAETVNQALKATYIAEQKAEVARKDKVLAKKRAEEVVQETINKEKVVIQAEAVAASLVEEAKGEAESIRTKAQGEADAILAKYKAEAEGVEAVLLGQASGFEKLIEAAGGNAQHAIGLMMVDKIENVAKIQTEAIAGLAIDNVTVFDGGSGTGIPNLINGITSALPVLEEFLGQSGMSLPNFLAKKDPDSSIGNAEPVEEVPTKD